MQIPDSPEKIVALYMTERRAIMIFVKKQLKLAAGDLAGT